MATVIKQYNSVLFDLANGLNTVLEKIIPETGTWVLQGGALATPGDPLVGNNLTELHICVSATPSLQGPPDGGPDAGHLPYINGQGQIVNSAMAIMDLMAGDKVYVMLNTKYTAGQLRGLSWLTGFKLP